MKKWLLSSLLCICMVFTLLSVTAMAADFTLTVAGTNVVNGNNVTYWLCDNGSITGTGASETNYNVKYDPTAITLTLNNANITVSEGNAIHDNNAINALTILLKGNNTVKSTADDAAGIYCQRYLTITAQEEGACLSVSGTTYGIQCGATTEINGKASVTAVGNNCALLSNRCKIGSAFKVYAGLDAGRAASVDNLDEINHNYDYPYARIEPLTNFIVTFDANGGSGTMNPQVFTNVHEELTANTFTCEYYAFAGWNTMPDGSGHSYMDKGWVWFSEPGEMTLYAQWQPFLYVAGVPVTSSNAADILGDGKVKYDLATNTLTLNGATITGDPAAEKMEGIYANDDLKIALHGENTVTASATRANAIVAIGSLTFEGSGTLNATNSGYCIQAHGGDVVISDVTVNAAGNGENSRGIVAFNNAGSGGDITITGGTVTAKGETYGICASNSITVSDSTVTADATTTRDGVTAYGIYGSNITISGSTVTATAASPRHSYGIIGSGYSNGFVAITDSTVIAKGTNALNKAPMLGDPADWYQWTTTEHGAMIKSTETQYTYDANHTYLKIEPIPAATVAVSSVTVVPTTLALTEGESDTLTATVAPDNATDKTVTWTSSNPAVATVDANGKVTAVDAGTATITVTTADGAKTATCSVTVSHDYTLQAKKAAALKTAGNCRDCAVYYYSCSACGEIENDDSHTFNGDKIPGIHVGGTRVEGKSEPVHKTQIAGSTGATICNGCGTTLISAQPIQPDAHTPVNAWSNDETNHWHTCAVAGCGIIIDSSKAAHSPDRDAATETDAVKCSVCGYVITPALGHTHTYGTAWKSDKDNHWNECPCGDKVNLTAHKDQNTDGKCDTCAYNVGISTPPAKPSTPQTGDSTMLWLYIALLFVSGFGVVTITLLGKKRFFTN